MKITLEQIVVAGIALGYPTRYWHPNILKYIYGIQNGRYILDLVKLNKQLDKARHILIKQRENGSRNIIFVSTTTGDLIEDRATASQRFFVKERWLGGILTNWKTIRLALLQISSLEREQKNGSWSILPKKETLLMIKRLIRLKRYLGGLQGIRSLPSAVVIIGKITESSATYECRKLGIPTICRLDTNCDPELANVGIPINQNSPIGARLVLEKLLLRVQTGCRKWLVRQKLPHNLI